MACMLGEFAEYLHVQRPHRSCSTTIHDALERQSVDRPTGIVASASIRLDDRFNRLDDSEREGRCRGASSVESTCPRARPRTADIASILMKSGAASVSPRRRARTLLPRWPSSMRKSTMVAESTTITGDEFGDVDVGQVDAVRRIVICLEPLVDGWGAGEL